MDLPAVYKINLKTATSNREGLVKYCLDERVLGMGWGYHYFSEENPQGFEDYYDAARRCWPDSKDLSSVHRFREAASGSLIWFRDTHGGYYLARDKGDWRLLDGRQAESLDLGSVRAIEWEPLGSEARVPGAVVRGFSTPRQWTFSHVWDEPTQAYSALLASEFFGGDTPDLEFTSQKVLDSYLGPLDVEDLVAAYLQDRREYVALPARQSKSKAVYEYVLKHRRDGHIAVVQVKTGNAPVPVETLDESIASKWFVYSKVSQDLPEFVERISAEDLIEFMESGSPALPSVTGEWMRRVD